MEKRKTVLVTNEITLKQIELEDANDIFNAISSQRVYFRKWLPFVDFTKEVMDTQNFVTSTIKSCEAKEAYTFVIHYNGLFVGLIGLKDIDAMNKKTEIGYWLCEDYQKKGIVTQSVKALINLAYNELDINRIQIKCAVGNIPSRNIPKRLGFQFEGIERAGELLVDNVFADIEVYSMLKSEFLG